jgi:SMC interacting uncharacterized protein involved in chromosome segregation
MSAKVHMDEETPHMHLVFLPVVHTTDKKGNEIDKIACSEFWKEKDSYRQLQNAFYKYMVANGFELQIGVAVEETNRKHYSVEEYKKITNFEKAKETLKGIKLKLPEVPDITDIHKLTIKRDEKIMEEIIKPKDDIIQNLYEDNINLHRELSRQEKVIEEAEKYQKERKKILADNEKLNEETKRIKSQYQDKYDSLESEFETLKKDLKYEYKSKYHKLEKENKKLHKIVDRFKNTVNIFIKWICDKFELPSSEEIVRSFEKENHILLDAEKQIEKEERQKDYELEL